MGRPKGAGSCGRVVGSEGGNRGSWGWEREGTPGLSISLPVLLEHSEVPRLQPRPPPTTTLQWGGGPREPEPLASSATTVVDRSSRDGERRKWSQGVQRGQEEGHSWGGKGNQVHPGWCSRAKGWSGGQAAGALFSVRGTYQAKERRPPPSTLWQPRPR